MSVFDEDRDVLYAWKYKCRATLFVPLLHSYPFIVPLELGIKAGISALVDYQSTSPFIKMRLSLAISHICVFVVVVSTQEDPGPSPIESTGCEPHGEYW